MRLRHSLTRDCMAGDDDDDDGAPPPPSRARALGARLLRKAGYNGFGGLGKAERGRVDPIAVAVKRDRRGVGTTRAYAVVGGDVATGAARTANRMSATATTTTKDGGGGGGGGGDDDDDKAREAKRAKLERAGAVQVKATRDANIARALYRAFKDDDTIGGSGGDANPLLRTGMSRSNPLRRSAR